VSLSGSPSSGRSVPFLPFPFRHKLTREIDEYLEHGHIAESLDILASERYRSLRDFASVYTVGHHKARELYDQHHCRTLEDVRQHYINIAEESEEVRLKEKQRRRQRGGMTHVDIVEEWMKLKDDLDSKYVALCWGPW
jgi:DNA polymerase mu